VSRAAPGNRANSRVASRTALVNRLRAARTCTVATVVAPPGYGKTTLLQQWDARDDRPFAWVTLEGAEDLDSFLARVAAALRSDYAYGWASLATPTVLVFDGSHLLEGEAADAVSRLISVTPEGSMVVLAGRSVPALRHTSLSKLRAGRRLLELGPRDLALTRREAASFLKTLGVALTGEQLTELLDRTEGWPAGLANAAATRDGHDAAEPIDECLGGLSADDRTFLRRTSVLERMCGPLCDDILRTSGSAAVLDRLERTSLFVVALDRNGEWCRYHHLLQERLRAELAETEPGLVPELHRRAADWLERNGEPQAAVEHAYQAGDRGQFTRVFTETALAAHHSGRDAIVERWLDRLDAPTGAADPAAAVLAARLHLHHGRLADAEACLAAAGRRGGAHKLLVQAAMCASGPEDMLADTEKALEQLSADDRWRPYGLLLQATAYALLGELERGDAILSRAVHAAGRLDANETLMLALAQRSLLASGRGEHAEADAHLLRAAEVAAAAGLEQYPSAAVVLALESRRLLRQGRLSEAEALLGDSGRLVGGLTQALPWLAAQARLELVAVHVMLRDAPGAAALLREVDRLLRGRNLTRLRAERNRLSAEVEAIPPGREGQTAKLTRAELRLLPLLGTHLSFREIGAHLYLSRHTVKTQAISAYRKLGATSRKQAVLQATHFGLIEAGAERPAP
jgi:LuxR family maltose regulon positive regulatory protein